MRTDGQEDIAKLIVANAPKRIKITVHEDVNRAGFPQNSLTKKNVQKSRDFCVLLVVPSTHM
jgi:hypothetical protein